MTSPVHPHARGEREICLVRLSVNQRCIPTDVGNAIATNATASYIIRFFSAGTEGVPEGAGNSACSDISGAGLLQHGSPFSLLYSALQPVMSANGCLHGR